MTHTYILLEYFKHHFCTIIVLKGTILSWSCVAPRIMAGRMTTVKNAANTFEWQGLAQTKVHWQRKAADKTGRVVQKKTKRKRQEEWPKEHRVERETRMSPCSQTMDFLATICVLLVCAYILCCQIVGSLCLCTRTFCTGTPLAFSFLSIFSRISQSCKRPGASEFFRDALDMFAAPQPS